MGRRKKSAIKKLEGKNEQGQEEGRGEEVSASGQGAVGDFGGVRGEVGGREGSPEMNGLT